MAWAARAGARLLLPMDESPLLPSAKLAFAEFFAGIGLVRMGLERAGWRCVFANDIDAQKLKMYQDHFSDAEEHFVLGDIRNLSPLDIPPIQLATASFPCTDLSLAGGRRGLAGEQSGALWPFLEVLRHLRTVRPTLVMLENVVGFLSSHGGGDFRSALRALNELGYAVDAFVVDAAHFVPQSRPRLFVIGSLPPGGSIASPQRDLFYEFVESEHRPAQLISFIKSNPDIRWSIRDLPPFPKRSTQLSELLEDLAEDDSSWWSEERSAYLLNQMSDRHRLVAERMIASGEITVGTVFRRVRNGRSMAELRTNGTAGCLRTPKGGSGRQILFVAGEGRYRVRLLSPRECARLMGADDFVLDVPLNQALFGFGDAVCVPVIEWIGRNYLTPLVSKADLKEVATAE